MKKSRREPSNDMVIHWVIVENNQFTLFSSFILYRGAFDSAKNHQRQRR